MLLKNDLIRLIETRGIEYIKYEHEALFSVEDSNKKRGVIDGAHTKNLFLKNKKNYFCLFSCVEDGVVDLKKFSKSIGAGNLSFARKEYLFEHMGIKPGSVSPYGLLNDNKNKIDFFLEYNLYISNKINFHPLINTSTISIKTKDFLNFMIENNKKITIFSLAENKIVETL